MFSSLIPFPLSAVFGYFYVSGLNLAHKESLKQTILPAVCQFFDGIEHMSEPGDSFERQRFQDCHVIRSGEWVTFEDLFVGRYRDTGFKMVEALVLTRLEGLKMFDGLLFEIGVPMEFSGHILIINDGWMRRVFKGYAGWLRQVFQGYTVPDEPRVNVDNAAFEARFAVYASDVEEAKRLVSPKFCNNMLALADSYSEKTLGAAFVDGVFLLAIPVKGDLFESGSIKQSVFDCENDIRELMREITTAHRVIDYFHGERSDKPD